MLYEVITANMLDRWGKDDKAILNESIEAIKNETKNMQELVQKLLFIARNDKNVITSYSIHYTKLYDKNR